MQHSISDLQAAINFVQNAINIFEHKIFSGTTIATLKGEKAETYLESDEAKGFKNKINELLEKKKQLSIELDNVIKEKFGISI